MALHIDLQGNIHDDMNGEALTLLPAGCTPITDDEAAKILKAQEPVLTYTQLRLAEYPPMADYLDGIVKGDTIQVQAYIDKCVAVKNKYPKG